jgi:hypothetical protein
MKIKWVNYTLDYTQKEKKMNYKNTEKFISMNKVID